MTQEALDRGPDGGRVGFDDQATDPVLDQLELAAAHGCARVAIPAISTGVYRYPLDEAAQVALKTTREALDSQSMVIEARFWLFDQGAYDTFSERLDRLASTDQGE